LNGARALRVLLVEDEMLIADYLALLIEEAGHAVLGPAATAAEALAILRDGPPDVAVLDVKLPGGMDGIELAAEIRRRHAGLPVVFASGSGDPTTRSRIEAAGALAFLQKPVDPVALLAALTRAARGGNSGVAL
jgi:CheY-like chemotaxis protein